MITPAYCRTMAAYNSEMNRRIYAAVSRLLDAERRRDRGAFFGSLHATLVHLLWGDCQWMSRFDGWERPTTPIKESGHMIENYAELCAERIKTDAGIEDWARRVDERWLDADMTWFSLAANHEVTAPRRFLVTHFFNHQTHHRGQAHALITAAGEKTADTDLFLVVPAVTA